MEDDKKILANQIKEKVSELEPLIQKAEKLGLTIQLCILQKNKEPIFRPTKRLWLEIAQVSTIKY